MPEAFAWSYKRYVQSHHPFRILSHSDWFISSVLTISISNDNGRRYKTGYVWQDLMDDDLMTPLSDNEYVLKGSEIVAASFGKLTN